MTDNTPQNPEAFSETPLENNHTNPQFEHLQYAWGDAALRGIAAAGCGRSDRQLNTFDYLADVPGNLDTTDFVEVQFKNHAKGFLPQRQPSAARKRRHRGRRSTARSRYWRHYADR